MAEDLLAPAVDISAYLDPEPPEETVPVVDESVWIEDNELTEAFHNLATAVALNLGEDVQVIPLKKKILSNRIASPHLVTRVEQRNVVDYAFKMSRARLSKQRLTIALRGSPGIGKSWSALLYIRKLMNQTTGRRPIIFEHGTPNYRKTYLLIGGDQDETWIAYLLRPSKVPEDWVDCSLIDIVVDPAQFGQDETPSPSLLVSAMGHCFIPASPDDRHLGSAHKESSLLLQLVLGPWLLKELKKGFPYMIYRNPTTAHQCSKKLYEDTMKTMIEDFTVLGGLPRYLVQDKARIRKTEITSKYAYKHAKELLEALARGSDFTDNNSEKVVTRFFTLRAGEDDKGYNPERIYATLDFVSPGVVKAAGKIILDKIQKDTIWRNSSDSSSIGFGF